MDVTKEVSVDFPLRFEDLEKRAKDLLDEEVFVYAQSGAGKEETLNANEKAFEDYKIVPRFLRDVSDVQTSKQINGYHASAPVLLAPIGMQGIVHPDGELASARAASEKGIPFISSNVSSYTLEEIAEVNGNGQRWFQLYYPKNVDLAQSFVRRAEDAGYSAIVITVDTAMLGNRERDKANGYSPFLLGKGVPNYKADPVFRQLTEGSDNEAFLNEMISNFYRPSLCWEDIQSIRDVVDLPIYLKGIVHPEDAGLAVNHGIDGIIVSNHGGRQLDGGIATLDALPAIKEKVGDALTVLLDSGIRRGPDVVKALALGADAVLLGRPYLYGLTIGGQSGVEHVLEQFLSDLKTTLTLSGIRSVEEINANTVIGKS